MLSQAKAKPPLNGAFVPIALNRNFYTTFYCLIVLRTNQGEMQLVKFTEGKLESTVATIQATELEHQASVIMPPRCVQ